MAICLKHFQEYSPNAGESCPYCDRERHAGSPTLAPYICPFCKRAVQDLWGHECDPNQGTAVPQPIVRFYYTGDTNHGERRHGH
jgi:hypothetical protein